MSTIKDFFARWFLTGKTYAQIILERFRTNPNQRTITIVVVVCLIFLLSYVFFIRAPRNFPADQLVEIPEGMSLSQIATHLKDAEVVRSALILRIAVVVLGDERNVQFGDYLFDTPKNVFVVARAIARGAHGLEPTRVRVPEGATVEEITALFEPHFQRFNASRFIEEAKPLEGYLFPDTYFFLPNADDELILRTLRESFDSHLAELASEIIDFEKPVKDIIIMASILEREAHNMTDRQKIAGVLWERLDRGMLLQVDATFLYSIGRTTFDLTTADLTSKNDPYNTYVNRGLPPTPIGSPSLSSIRAAVTPLNQGDYLFYLADHSNVTHYSKTYEEHLRLKRLYLDS